MLEEEFNLRPYVWALRQRWKWIIGAVLASVTAALAISLLLPPVYEATAVVVITQVRENVQFDTRFETTTESRPLKAFPELATSDELLKRVLEQLPPGLGDYNSIGELRRVLNADVGGDPSLLRLSAQANNGKEAAELANIWAEVYVDTVGRIYTDFGSGQVHFYEGQLTESADKLSSAETALIEFQARNPITSITNELKALESAQANYFLEQQLLVALVQNVSNLRMQLANQPSTQPVSLADQVTALLLQIRAYDAQSEAPLQFQLNATNFLSAGDREDQLLYLDNLLLTLDAKSDDIKTSLRTLEPAILELQRQKQASEVEYDRLVTERTLAQETFTALARKLAEERITSEEASGGIYLASRAAHPQAPIGPRTGVNLAVAAVVGGTIMMIFILIVTWWRQATN